MFQFPASAPTCVGTWPSTMWVPPFGHLRINSCLQIPGAFRSLPRPSSLPEAKASPVRSCSLSRTFKWILATFTSQIFTRFAFEIAVPILATRKNSNFNYTDYNLFLTSYLVISLSIVKDLSNPFFEVSLIERDGKGTHFFWTSKSFSKNFRFFFAAPLLPGAAFLQSPEIELFTILLGGNFPQAKS